MKTTNIHEFFSSLIAPISTEDFFSNYWQKAPGLFKGDKAKLTDMFGREDVHTWLVDVLRNGKEPRAGESGDEQPVGANIQLTTGRDATTKNVAGSGRAEDVFSAPVPLRVAAKFLSENMSEGMLFVHGVHRLNPDLMELCGRIRGALRQPGNVHTYLFHHSSAGKGRGLHFDSDDTFFFQVSGTRKFRVSKAPIRSHPPFAARLTPGGEWRGVLTEEDVAFSIPPPAEIEIEEHYLSPGDVLYFPSGSVHETSTPEGNSLGCAISITSMTAISFLQGFMTSVVDGASLPWRGPARLAEIAELSDMLSQLVQLHQQSTDLPARMHDELFTQAAGPTSKLLEPFPVQELPSGQVEPSTRLRCHPEKLFLLDRRQDPDSIHLHVDAHDLEFDEPRMFAFAEGLAAFREFCVSECLAWGSPAYRFDELKESLQTLVELGCLVPTGESS